MRRLAIGGHERTTWRGIRTTTAARTLADLAAVLPLDDLARARGDAHRRYTYKDVFEAPLPMLEDLAGLLGFPAFLA